MLLTKLTIFAAVVVVEEENETGWCLVRMPDDPDQAGWVPIDYLQRLLVSERSPVFDCEKKLPRCL